MFVSTVILFNHESPLRPASFVTRKITSGAVRIAAGQQDVAGSRPARCPARLGRGIGLHRAMHRGPAAGPGR